MSGFGTLGYAVLDDDNAEYRTGEARDGASASGSLEVDSRLGLQADAVFTERWSATVQAIVRESESGEPAAALEWGLLRWLPTDRIAVRVGRIGLPAFAISDYREVGYASVLLRPAEDVYSQIPLRRFDGADITVDGEIGDTLLQGQLFYGQAREKIFSELEPDARDSIGISGTLERGPFKVRISHVSADIDIDSGSAGVARVRAGIAQAQALVPSLAALADDFAGKRVPFQFNSLAVGVVLDRVFVDLEFAQRRVESWVPDVDSWALAIGTQFATPLGTVRPYVFLSAVEETQGDRRVDLPENPLLDPLEAGINVFYEPRDQNTIGVGARLNLSDHVSLSAQVDQISREARGISFFRPLVDDDSDEGNDVMLFSAAIDFIF